MSKDTLRFSTMLSMVAILLVSCTGQNVIESTATPMPTIAPSPTGTSTPVPTAKAIPSETAISGPASLAGSVFLLKSEQKPFVSRIELRQTESFALSGSGQTNSSGVFDIKNIVPGIYELWVLITSKPAMISGCTDIAGPDGKWQTGIEFEGNKSMSMQNAYLSKALFFYQNLPSSDFKAQGFFAVLPDFEIKPGIENKVDIVLICK